MPRLRPGWVRPDAAWSRVPGLDTGRAGPGVRWPGQGLGAPAGCPAQASHPLAAKACQCGVGSMPSWRKRVSGAAVSM